MATSDFQAGAFGAGTGALGGAGTGAMVGTYLLPGLGTALGAGIGAGVGLLGGAITGVMDNNAQQEMEEALQAEKDAIDAAQRNFERAQLQAGDLAQEVLTQTMTTKNTADQAKADMVMGEASQVADASGLIGAEKADYILKQRESVMKSEQASNPQFAQAALGGAKALRDAEVNKAAITLQSEQNQSQAEMQRIAGQQLPDYSGSFGDVLGSISQVAGAAGMINAYGAGAGAAGGMAQKANAINAGTGAAKSVGESLAPTPMTDTEIMQITGDYGENVGTASQAAQNVQDYADQRAFSNQVGDMLPQSQSGNALGGSTPAPTAPVATTATAPAATAPAATAPAATAPAATTADQGFDYAGMGEGALGGSGMVTTGDANTPAPFMEEGRRIQTDSMPPFIKDNPNLQDGYTWMATQGGGMVQVRNDVPFDQMPTFASGGMAGATGPEVAILGEEGPELVLNAKQTKELAQALGGAKPLAMGGVAGADDEKKKKIPGYAGGGVAGMKKIPGYADGGVAGMQQKQQSSPYEMNEDELLEYLETMTQQMNGAL